MPAYIVVANHSILSAYFDLSFLAYLNIKTLNNILSGQTRNIAVFNNIDFANEFINLANEWLSNNHLFEPILKKSYDSYNIESRIIYLKHSLENNISLIPYFDRSFKVGVFGAYYSINEILNAYEALELMKINPEDDSEK